jgi:hypothetical protein
MFMYLFLVDSKNFTEKGCLSDSSLAYDTDAKLPTFVFVIFAIVVLTPVPVSRGHVREGHG